MAIQDILLSIDRTEGILKNQKNLEFINEQHCYQVNASVVLKQQRQPRATEAIRHAGQGVSCCQSS